MIINPFKLAKDVFYNNKNSKLSATNVQGAVDEINSIVESKVAKDIPYTHHEMEVTNVDGALGELFNSFVLRRHTKRLSVAHNVETTVWQHTAATTTLININASLSIPASTSDGVYSIKIICEGVTVDVANGKDSDVTRNLHASLKVRAGGTISVFFYHTKQETLEIECEVASSVTGTFAS